MTGMRACVTGANGFVGSNLCRTLIAAGHAVRGIVRPSADRRSLDGIEGLELREGDLGDPRSLERAFAEAEVVFHCAARTSDWGPCRLFLDSNLRGVRHVMQAARARGVRRVVHISSVSVYGFPCGADIAEDLPWIERPDDPYISSKQQGERAAMECHGDGLEVAVLRPGGIYGPWDRVTSLPLFAALERRRFAYVDGGRYRMAPVYIDNLLQAALLAATRGEAAGQVYNVGDAGEITWRRYIERACRHLNCAPPALSVPAGLAWPLACLLESAGRLLRLRTAPGLTRYRVRAVIGDRHYSSAKAMRELGYAPAIATEEGLRRTADWYRANTAGRNRRMDA